MVLIDLDLRFEVSGLRQGHAGHGQGLARARSVDCRDTSVLVVVFVGLALALA